MMMSDLQGKDIADFTKKPILCPCRVSLFLTPAFFTPARLTPALICFLPDFREARNKTMTDDLEGGKGAEDGKLVQEEGTLLTDGTFF